MSKKNYGCFFCQGHSSDFSGKCSICGEPVDVSNELVAAHYSEFVSGSVLGRGFYGWTLRVEDEYQPFALKIIPEHRLKKADNAPVFHEAKALVACSPHRNIARFVRTLKLDLIVKARSVKAVGLLFDFIPNALPLNRFLSERQFSLQRTDVASVVIGISSGLGRLHSRKLWHHDLHDDNILVRVVQPDENLPERFEPKLIDFGSAFPMDGQRQEPDARHDYQYLSKHILNLLARFEYDNVGALSPSDRSFCSKLRDLAHQLQDPNISRRDLNPLQVVEIVNAALGKCSTGQLYPSFEEMKKAQLSILEPLVNTNALSLEPQDIVPLFQDEMGWTPRINKSEPVLVVGPRGCGKTMFLRWLSISSRARPTREETDVAQVADRISKMEFIGFLVNVGQLRTPFLRNSFSQLEMLQPKLAEDFSREFLNTHFCFEVVRTLQWLNTENVIKLSSDDQSVLFSNIRSLLDVTCVEAITFGMLSELLDKRIIALSNLRNAQDYSPSRLCGDDVLDSLAKALKGTCWGKEKGIWFLLDDYSVTVIPAIAQRAYNPVIFRLSSDFRIKLSSEGDGPILSDSMGRKYREGRELTKLNFGEVYFSATEKRGQEFLTKILAARFRGTGKGSMEEILRLLGEHPNEEAFAREILKNKRPGDVRFHGYGLLCRLCSGDVSFIIELLHQLVGSKLGSNSEPLKPSEQDAIIKRFAQRQLEELHSTAKYGERLHEFATGLGSLIKDYLVKSSPETPDERLRLEVQGEGELSEEAQELHDALLRFSVLVSGGTGKSRAALPTRKLFFRRLFAPCFPFSPNHGDCIAVSIAVYEKWLTNPKLIGKRRNRSEGDSDDELPLK